MSIFWYALGSSDLIGQGDDPPTVLFDIYTSATLYMGIAPTDSITFVFVNGEFRAVHQQPGVVMPQLQAILQQLTAANAEQLDITKAFATCDSLLITALTGTTLAHINKYIQRAIILDGDDPQQVDRATVTLHRTLD